jgi:beta-lactamase class D
MTSSIPHALFLLIPLLFTVPETHGPVVERPDLSHFFDESGYNGSFLLYDLKNDSFIAVNAATSDERFTPASTFKIFNSLVALETGVIKDESTVISWDGRVRGREELNRDHDLESAIRYSVVPYYQELARRIGRERMQHYIDSVGYGNGDISGPIDLFWLEGSLKISPMEQMAFLVRLYRNDLPFSMRTMEIVRRILPMETGDEFILRGKTGWAVRDSANVGWWVGWVERRDRTCFFATVLRSDHPREDFGAVRLALTRKILHELQVLP